MVYERGRYFRLNLQEVGTAGWDGYGLRLYKQIGGYVWDLYQYANGSGTNSLGSWGGGPASGDRAMLRRVGSQLQAWYYTAATGTWEQKVSANAANFGNYVNGRIGVQIIDNGYGGPPILHDFGGTESFGPEPPPVPAPPVLEYQLRSSASPERDLTLAGGG